MGNLRNLHLTETVLNSILFFARKSEPFFLQPVKVHSIFFSPTVRAGKNNEISFCKG